MSIAVPRRTVSMLLAVSHLSNVVQGVKVLGRRGLLWVVVLLVLVEEPLRQLVQDLVPGAGLDREQGHRQ